MYDAQPGEERFCRASPPPPTPPPSQVDMSAAFVCLVISLLLPRPRYGPAVTAGCRAGQPALGPRPAAGRTQVIAYHKPVGLIVTHNDELDRPTVYEHLAEQPGFPEGRWDAVGRLDLNTSGLLLLTNDGWLLRHVTDPTSGTTRLPKTYRVLASKVLGEAVLEQLRRGVELGGGLGLSGPAEVEVLGHGKGSTRLLLTLREGKNRQVAGPRRTAKVEDQRAEAPGTRAAPRRTAPHRASCPVPRRTPPTPPPHPPTHTPG